MMGGAASVAQASKRLRHHVNPFRPDLQQPAEVQWADIFEDPMRPLIVDVGCASGRFLLAIATKLPQYNLLGLDIRRPVCSPHTCTVCPAHLLSRSMAGAPRS